MIVELNEQQRNEVFLALSDRKAQIAKHVKALTADGMTKEAQLAEKRSALYATSGKVVGLLPMFADQTDLDEERAKRGEKRADDGTQDMFGGGTEVGGAPAPAASKPEKNFMGKGGELFETDEQAQASWKLPDADATTAAAADEASDVGAPIAQPGIKPRLALMAGEGVEGEVHEGKPDALTDVESADLADNDSEDDDDDYENDGFDVVEEASDGEEGDGDAADGEIARETAKGDDWLAEPLRTTPEA